MRIKRLDHVNIRTDDIPGTVQFFTDVFGLTSGPAPGLPPERYVWMRDDSGAAPVHINAKRPGDGEGAAGAIHHFAFACDGHDDLLAVLGRLGVEWVESRNDALKMRQVFFLEPNGARIECSFVDDA